MKKDQLKKVMNILPAIRMLLSRENIKVLKLCNNNLIASFCKSPEAVKKVLLLLVPDNKNKVSPLYISDTSGPENIIKSFALELKKYKKKRRSLPKVILLKGMGMICAGDNIRSAESALDTFKEIIKSSHHLEKRGRQDLLINREVESDIPKTAEPDAGKVANKIAIVTGGALGIGRGISEGLLKEGANVVIADINSKKGKELESDFNKQKKNNKAIFIETDITDPLSIQDMLFKTVSEFGGLDILISNAGVLKAGSLEEMKDDDFSFVTKVNYTGYYLCAKYSSRIMKLQHIYKDDHFTDIIQINSKSGLKGSNKNFAYAGGKFGGIGLTQSFALELVKYRIKVNSGNFFEGPLWSDPKKGLFFQYLKAGKVLNAKSIKDVKQFYENLVPMKRGCHIEDIMKAVYYLIDQKYETGQAMPVTGGQVMLK